MWFGWPILATSPTFGPQRNYALPGVGSYAGAAIADGDLAKVGWGIATMAVVVIAVAFFIGTIELVTVLHHKLGLTDPLTGWISSPDLDNAGFVIVGLFVVVWAAALASWRLAGVEKRWAARAADNG
ncbi:hypothetical protein [Streptomyces lydicus]|uniref:HoxN/HupN/NixA family nickel/cobalt transporter n=1 Tax=Streptomyces lydicus TaxID=47763 RepID=UPI003F4E1AB2